MDTMRTVAAWARAGSMACLCWVSACGTPSTGPLPSVQSGPSVADYTAAPHLAKVVFVRHSSVGSERAYSVVHDGTLVATLTGDMHVVVDVQPGEQTFYLVASNSEPVHAMLEAGKTYVVEARPHGAFAGDGVVAEAVPITRLAEVRGWIQTTPSVHVAMGETMPWSPAEQRDVQRKVAGADQDWNQQDVFWRAKHTLRPNDGVVGNDLRF